MPSAEIPMFATGAPGGPIPVDGTTAAGRSPVNAQSRFIATGAPYGRLPVNTSGGRAVVAGPPRRRSVGKGAPYGRLPVTGGRAPAKKILLVKVSFFCMFDTNSHISD